MNTNTVPPFVKPSPPPRLARKRPDRELFIGLSALVTLVLIGSIWGAFLLFHPSPTSAPNQLVGQASFMSSGQWNDNSSQGDNDQLQIELQNVPAPGPGKIYYVWLLNDKDQSRTVALPLGVLPVDHGNVHFPYKGDALHTNLLATTSRLLITEENQQSMATQPAADRSTWRYYAELPQQTSASSTSKPTVLSSLRTLLYQEPHLSQIGIHDGLNIQFLRNIGKILEWTYSARDTGESWGNHDAGFIRRQLVRTLYSLDGKDAVQADIPPGTPLPLEPIIPLIDVAPNQAAASYIDLIHQQLTNLMAAPGVTPSMHTLALKTDQALTAHVQPELIQVRLLAKQLVALPEAQLLTPRAQALLNSIVVLTNLVLVGQLDQLTNEPQPGTVQIFYNIQHLATYDIKPYTLH